MNTKHLLTLLMIVCFCSCKKNDNPVTESDKPIADTPQTKAADLIINHSGEPAVNRDIQFGSNARPGNVVWHFGDGDTSAALNPKHRYMKPGKYNVTLTVSTGTSPAKELSINVNLGDKIAQTHNWERWTDLRSYIADTTFYYNDTSFALTMKSDTEIVLPHNWGTAKFDTIANDRAIFSIGSKYSPHLPPMGTHSYTMVYYYYSDNKLLITQSTGGMGGSTQHYHRSK